MRCMKLLWNRFQTTYSTKLKQINAVRRGINFGNHENLYQETIVDRGRQYLYKLCAAYRRLRQTFLKTIAFEVLYNNDKDRLIQVNGNFILQFNQNEIHLRTNGQCNILTIV